LAPFSRCGAPAAFNGVFMVESLKSGESFLVDALDGARLLHVSERKYHELRRDPGFPAAVMLGTRCVRWHRDELLAYARSLPRVGMLPEPKHLAARAPAKA
jgi:hypothetical protein